MAKAIADIEGMDSVSRAGPNLHYGEDWTLQLQDTPLKGLMEPDPQLQTGEWLPCTMKNSKVQKINSIGELENQRLSDSGRSEESPRNEQIMGGDPPENGAKSWLKTKRPGGEKPGPGASVIGGTSPPLGMEIHRRPLQHQ